MPLRQFRDADGTEWMAWSMSPPRCHAPARSSTDRRRRITPGFTPERRKTPDRRHEPFTPALAYGWMCFESEGEMRRLVGPPEGWDEYSDRELAELCRRASAERMRRS